MYYINYVTKQKAIFLRWGKISFFKCIQLHLMQFQVQVQCQFISDILSKNSFEAFIIRHNVIHTIELSEFNFLILKFSISKLIYSNNSGAT